MNLAGNTPILVNGKLTRVNGHDFNRALKQYTAACVLNTKVKWWMCHILLVLLWHKPSTTTTRNMLWLIWHK